VRRSPAVLLLLLAACGGGGHDDHGAGGTPARTIEVKAEDRLRFDPATIAGKPGEQVRFRVVNTGKLKHEFVIGDAAYHATHRDAASTPGASHGGHGAGGASVEVAPGTTAELTFTLPDAAPAFACYVDRHDQAGMTGNVTY
jgi:uncharacterized cupredoxin-like copper-binding protein